MKFSMCTRETVRAEVSKPSDALRYLRANGYVLKLIAKQES